MVSRLRWPTVAIALLSIILSIAVVGCAGRTIHIFNTQQKTNQWLLPVWRNHFDTRELSLLVGTSATTIVLNLILVVALFIAAAPANIIVVLASFLGTICSATALIFTAVLNHRSPMTDTIQTWTCRWTTSLSRDGAPDNFNTLCNETRFAFYTMIPLFVLQAILLTLAFGVMTGSRAESKAARLYDEPEKGVHELGSIRNASFDTKSEGSPKTAKTRVQIVAN
ncbi:Hypothetical protein R9X50_00622600 [Acrodontium crateriforme]|uniref:Uncharacterized protein n=1 Tax=Acrodontium crateriforme TaxID=150365 RepID=A0AAQ3M9M4_9PEZI|nr:Hypothetical protein R9X50_00622600 [Acrodontium crateriforme]